MECGDAKECVPAHRNANAGVRRGVRRHSTVASRVAAEAQVGVDVRVINVAESEAELLRFLGSPSIRVHGHDVEPGADSRRDYAHSCRLYDTSAGLRPLPDEAWLHDALTTIRSPAEADGS